MVREIHFRDRRPPHEIQFEFERALMTLMPPAMENAQLVYRADAKVNGLPHRFLLRFEAALFLGNCYYFRAEVLPVRVPFESHDATLAYLSSWFDVWTMSFKASAPPDDGAGSSPRYDALAEKALTAVAQLESVAALQQEILNALRGGATFSTAHKEGGTTIRFAHGRFVRAEYGESNTTEEFHSDAAFLAFLREFYDWQTSRNSYPQKVPELVAWKLMLRLLRP